MIFLVSVLLVCFFAAVAFGAYQLSEAKRWRQVATEARDQQERQAQTQQQLEGKFRGLAADALQNNSQLFLDRSREQIQHLVEPVNQSLRRFEEQVQAIEVSRAGAYSDISAQVGALTQLQERVRQSTDQLKNALRSPIQRGRWGEMQLRRVVELAGMLDYCDFAEQKTLFGETNQRPDLIIRLPNHCEVVVDAKVSLEAYLRAIECQDDAERSTCLRDHARQVRTHVKSLGEKAYWQRLSCSPEFVVAFLPLESLFSAALESDPTLLDFGVEHRVMIATPVSLISLLLVIAHGWRQQVLAENIDKIRTTGLELYTRILAMSGHFIKLGDAIEKTVSTYNDTVGSLEHKVLSSARKFSELRPAGAEQLEEMDMIESGPRTLEPSKWAQSGGAGF
jgi:DNA recombination protein RmuC